MDPLAVLGALPDPVIVLDTEARLTWANRTAEAVFGWELHELQGESVAFLCHPDDLATGLVSLTSVQQKEIGTAIDLRLRDRNGVYRTYEVRGRDVPDVGIILGLRDVTDRGGWDVARGDAGLYRSILDHAPAITMHLDGEGRIRGASRALTSQLGRDLESSIGHHLREFVDPADALTVEAEVALAMSAPGQRSFEVAFTTKDGAASVPMSVTIVNLLDDRTVEGLVVNAIDITALAESRARLRHLAHHDPLTELPNRASLTDRLQDALTAAVVRGSRVNLIYCDLDGLKSVNDRHGHEAGDHVLREVAARLVGATRAGDAVARMGGDEFVVLVEEGDERAVETLMSRITDAIAKPIVLPGGATASITITAGAAAADGRAGVDDLLRRADAAMYAAKGDRRR
jgi:diguanylate cyclase (GGDEF)-like protein/PAS domain S-box-containing protein